MAQQIPTDRVQQLRQQGYTNSQVIDILQRDGFNSSQIFDAMNHSDIPNAGAPSGNLPPPPDFDAPQAPPQQFTPQVQAPPAQEKHSAPSDVSTEEYIEAIIDEKWTEIEDDVQKIVDWKNRSEQRLTQLTQQVTDLKDRFEKLHAALIGKIETYDRNILEVGAEIKAMEKVFSKVLPVFTDNVKRLDEITDKMDRRSGAESAPPSRTRSGVAR